jgi:hypothetical protein
MMKKYGIIIYFIFCPFTFGNEVTVGHDNTTIVLEDLLNACEEIANSKSSARVHAGIPGKIIIIRGIRYEVRFFSFEDTKDKMSSQTTFREYVKANNLQTMPAKPINVLNRIQFESFDFRRSDLKDNVYFSMAIRRF